MGVHMCPQLLDDKVKSEVRRKANTSTHALIVCETPSAKDTTLH